MYFSFHNMTNDGNMFPLQYLTTWMIPLILCRPIHNKTFAKVPPLNISRNDFEKKKIDGDIYYLPLAKDFSTPIMDAGIAMATNAKAKLGSSSIRLCDLI